MLDTTTTTANLGASATSNTTQPLTTIPSTHYLCTSCRVSFNQEEKQRMHMRDPWHVHNVKRRMSSLPPVEYSEYHVQTEKLGRSPANRETIRIKTIEILQDHYGSNHDHHQNSSGANPELDDDISEFTSTPFQCLFCAESFPITDLGLASNLTHMHDTHDFSIPHQNTVSDLQAFIGYLALEVRAWHECLYCGANKSTTESVQNHMRDKGHCILNLDREPELCDFWEHQTDSSDTDSESKLNGAIRLSETELRMTSGKVITSRQERVSRRTSPHILTEATALIILAHTTPSDDEAPPVPAVRPSPCRQLARSDEQALTGVSPFQRQQLALATKKAQRSEAVAQRANDWIVARKANKQKFDQIDGSGKWGKQNHKLQPR